MLFVSAWSIVEVGSRRYSLGNRYSQGDGRKTGRQRSDDTKWFIHNPSG